MEVVIAILVAGVLLFGVKYLRDWRKKKSDPLEYKTFKDRATAENFYRDECLKEIREFYYYKLPVRCKNCNFRGVTLILKNYTFEQSICPVCHRVSLTDTVDKKRVNSHITPPPLPKELEELLEGTVKNAVEDAWDTGKIKRTGLFQ